jgi:exopolysaccharide production protein ExoZ
MQSRTGTLYSLQAGRGIAACLVVLFHQTLLFQLPKYWGASPIGGVFIDGYVGVHFFFVLSGFIIAFAHHSDIGQPGRLLRYARRRVTRLLPFYWLVTLVALPAFIAYNSGLGFRMARIVAASFVLVPFAGAHADGAVLDVAWTLFYEAAFYALFAVLIYRRNLGLALVLLWLLAILLSWHIENPFYLFDPINLLFFFGLAAFATFKSVRVPLPILVAFLGIAGMAAGVASASDHSSKTVLIGLGAALIVLGLAEAERSRPSPALKVFEVLGGASYAIYLIHFPLLSLLAKIFLYAGLYQWPLISFVLMTIGVLAAGIAAHLFVERPLIDWTRQRWRGDRAITNRAAGPAEI